MRPIIEIKPTKKDIILDVLGILVLILFWIYIINSYPNLPNIIPIHFNLNGEADGFGSKNFIFLTASIATILYIGLSILIKYPHTFNYAIEITHVNAETQYKNSINMIRILKLIIILIFFITEYYTVSKALNEKNIYDTLYLPFILILLFGTIIYFLIKSFSLNKKSI